MPVFKNFRVDLRGQYKRHIEICIAIAILILILAFKYSPQKSGTKISEGRTTDWIPVVNNLPTAQKAIPPRVKPIVPVFDLNPITEDIELPPSDLNITANIPAPPPRKEIKKLIEEEVPPFDFAEDMPEPIGGAASIQAKIHYTEIARKIGIEGKVIVLAVVDKHGDVIDAKIIKPLFPSLDEIALNAVINTKFLPGRQRGKPVPVKITIPILFHLR
jgi:protein TonB